MKLDAQEELAIILPIPVVQPAKEGAVNFADLSGYPGFFKDLEKAFPAPLSLAYQGDLRNMPLSGGPGEPLEVQRVGSFNASFVPTIADFSRLDVQFRLEDAVWKSLPQYKDSGDQRSTMGGIGEECRAIRQPEEIQRSRVGRRTPLQAEYQRQF